MKAEQLIKNHSMQYPDIPMFLYYSMQLVHRPYDVPDIYLDRCEYPTSKSFMRR